MRRLFIAVLIVSILSFSVGYFVIHTTTRVHATTGATQAIVGGYPSNLSQTNGTSQYNELMGGYNWNNTETYVEECMPDGGTFSNLYCRVSVAPGSTYSYAFTVMVGASAQALTCTISGANTTANDTNAGHDFTVSAGNVVALRCTTTGTPASAAYASWSVDYTPTNDDESVCLFNTASISGSGNYTPIEGGNSGSATEGNVKAPMPDGGTFKDLYVSLSGTLSSGSATFTLRYDGSSSALTCTITYSATTGNDTTHTVTAAAGHLVDFLNVASSGSSPYAACGMIFTPTNDGDSLVIGGIATLNTSSPNYFPLGAGSAGSGSTTEANEYSLTQVCTLKNFYVNLSTSPGGSNSYNFHVDVNGGTAGLTLAISAASTQGSDTSHSYTPSAGQTCDIYQTFSGGVNAAVGCWSVVAFNSAASAPTITISAATSVAGTTATLNGTVTSTGTINPTVTVYWGTSDGGQTPGSWANNAAPTSPSQPQGAASFYLSVTGLSTGTTYYFSAKATNSVGTGWPAASLNFLTIPAAPTGVSATQGSYTNKVTITWSASIGATGYDVLRNGSDVSGALGSVTTYDDTTAAAGTITPGTASATTGSSLTYVTVSLSGQSVANGTSYTYTVTASDATGTSSASSSSTGYRGTGSLTYQWQRSASDYDGNYSTLPGATTAPYNDSTAPAAGTGVYYNCVESATGTTNATSTSARGYIGVPSGSSTGLGLMILGGISNSTTYSSGLSAFTITNNGNVAIDVTIQGSNLTGGTTWTLSDTATPGANTYGLEAGLNGGSYNVIVKLDPTYNTLISNLSVGSSQSFGLEFLTPTSNTDTAVKTGTVTCNVVMH